MGSRVEGNIRFHDVGGFPQDGQEQAADVAVGAGVALPTARRPSVGWPARQPPAAQIRDRAATTPRLPRGANQCTKLHRRHRPAGRKGWRVWNQRSGLPQLRRGLVRPGVLHPLERAGEHSPHVAVHDRMPGTKGKGRDGSGRVRTHTRQAKQIGRIRRDLAVVPRHDGNRRLVQPKGAPWVPEPAPCSTAKSAGAGQRASQAFQTGSTRLTWVCWSMTSLTRTPHGVASGRRHGRSRAACPYHSRTRSWSGCCGMPAG